MAYLLRSLAVIGVIALNSPVHGGKSADGDALESARMAAKAVTQWDARSVTGSLTAAREAAQILAGLDPQTRQRVLALATSGKPGEVFERAGGAGTR